MFSVFGKSLAVAKKTVDKLIMNRNSDLSVKLREMALASQTERQSVVDKAISEVFESMKVKRCTHEFSTPEIASEALEIMKKDTVTFSHLSIMKKRPKKNEEGNIKISKATRKPLMEWVPLHEEEEIQKAA